MNTEEDWKREREESRPCRFCDGRGWVVDRNAPSGGSPCGCDEPQDDDAPPVPSVSGGEYQGSSLRDTQTGSADGSSSNEGAA